MEPRALIFDIKRDCSEDGPGIRTTVFFKGCPLSCIWCQNPEGKSRQPVLTFTALKCHPEHCATPCIEACPRQCLTLSQGGFSIDRNRCLVCNDCCKACPSGALQVSGYWIGLEELVYRLLIDKPFYQSSGGGVTLSGGEVTQQMNFAHQLLKALKQEGIHTAIETSGFFNYRRFSSLLLPWLDMIYFDLKLIDDAAHRKHTGQSNRPILDNFRRLVQTSSIPVIPRVPLIPGITTHKNNLQGIAEFLITQGIDAATLLPYNPLWADKAVKLGERPQYHRITFMTQKEKQGCLTAFQTTGSIPPS